MTGDASAESDAEPLGRGEHLVGLLPRGLTAVAVAVASAALVAASFADYGLGGRALLGAVLCSVLTLLTAIDIRHRLLPNAIVLPSTALIAVIVAATEPGKLVLHAVVGVAFAGVLLPVALLSPAGLGMGDVKLALLIGVALGSQTLTALLVSSIAILALTLVLLAVEGRAALKRTIPFGPILALGAVVAFFLA